MAIQHRRGFYRNFDPTRLVAGEWAVVLNDDPSAADGRAAYVCFGAGLVKRVATYEDMVDWLANLREETIDQVVIDAIADIVAECEQMMAAMDAAEANRSSAEHNRSVEEFKRMSREIARDEREEQRVAAEGARQRLAEDLQQKLEDHYFDGATYTPSVSDEGILSWSNNKDFPNPESKDIRGPKGNDGVITSLETGFYMLQIIDGDLCILFGDGTEVPDFFIDEEGCLCVDIEGE